MSGFRSVRGVDSSSSPEERSTSLSSIEGVADLDTDYSDVDSDDSAEDAYPEPGPGPASDRAPATKKRAPPPKPSAGASRRPSGPSGKSGKSAGKSAVGRSPGGSASRSPTPSPTPIIPRRPEDWAPWKGVLHDLYITQNRILRDIIVIMDTKYNVRATPKMYKNQFARWNFFKYAIKRRPRNRSLQESDEPHGNLALTTSRRKSSSVDGLVSPLLHESSRARVMQTGLKSVRDFLQTYIKIDPTAREDMVMLGYQDPSFRYFTAAMDLFDHQDNAEGGLLLRRAFLQIEQLLSTMTIKAFSDLLLVIPHLLIESGRADILMAYLRYLSGLASTKFPNHPINDVIASFAELVDEPEAMIRFIMSLSKAHSDTLLEASDAKDRTRKWAHNLYVACQRTSLKLGNDSSHSKHAHNMLRVESQSVYWAQHLVMGDAESDKLAELWMFRNFPPDFAPRTEAYVAKVKALGEAGILPPPYARMMECLYIGWLNDYYETKEDWPKVFEWARKGLLLSTGEQYQVWSIHVEELMRKHGSVEEAEEMRKKRLSHEFLETVRADVEKMSLGFD